MKKITFILICAILFHFGGVCAQNFDTLYTIKGDTVLCKIIKQSTDKFIFKLKGEHGWYETHIKSDEVDRYRYYEIEKLKHEFDTSAIYNISVIDGTILYGKITEIFPDRISLKTLCLGIVTIKATNFKKIKRSDDLPKEKGGKYWFPNPHYSRYFFAPSAKPLKKGDGYFHDIYILILSANYAFTDNILIGGGFSIIPGLSFSEQLFLLNPKVGFNLNEKWSIGGGFFLASVLNEMNYIIGYSVATYGSNDNNLTFGLGYGALNGQWSKGMTMMAGGMLRISKRVSLLTEKWVLPTRYSEDDDNTDTEKISYITSGIISYGLRFFGEQICVDLAFFNVLSKEFDELFFPGIPYVDFVVKF